MPRVLCSCSQCEEHVEYVENMWSLLMPIAVTNDFLCWCLLVLGVQEAAQSNSYQPIGQSACPAVGMHLNLQDPRAPGSRMIAY